MPLVNPGISPYSRHVNTWSKCTACSLCELRKNVVLCRGSLPADVLFVGEAPGQSEDSLGKPFKGPAGHLLDNIVQEATLGYDHLKVAYTNLVACFPSLEKKAGTNEPKPENIVACRERLVEIVKIANPRLLVAVGTLSGKWLYPKNTNKHSRMVQERPFHKTIPHVEITHPAAILRAPTAQREIAIHRCVIILQNAFEEL